MRDTLFTLAIAVVAAGIPTQAHHSFAADYFERQSISIEGQVQEFRLQSPHAVLVVTTDAPGDRVATYTAEWGSPRRLDEQGITKDTLKPGDVVVVTGSPGRTASAHKVHLKEIRRPADGWSWSSRRRR